MIKELMRPSDNDIQVAIKCLQENCVTDCSITIQNLLEYVKALELTLDSIMEIE